MADKLVATLDKAGVRKISTDLWGVFFEDISYSGDGGLNSELVQNGAFEYNRADKPEWSNYTAWRKIVPAGSFAGRSAARGISALAQAVLLARAIPGISSPRDPSSLLDSRDAKTGAQVSSCTVRVGIRTVERQFDGP